MTFTTPLLARTVNNPSKIGEVPFFNPGRLLTLQPVLGSRYPTGNSISTADRRVNNEWNQRVLGTPSYYEPSPFNPFSIPSAYDDPEASDALLDIVNADFSAAVDLALKWQMLGDELALESVIAILTGWAGTTSIDTAAAGSALNFLDKWPMMIQAAMMVRDSDLYTPTLHNALSNVTSLGFAVSYMDTRTNNTASWSVCFEIAAAVFLNDHARFRRCVQRWREIFDAAVVTNVPIHEVHREGSGTGNGRSGLWYSNFLLSAMIVAAEWARFGGEWLYDYNNAEGSSIEGLTLQVREWTRNPGSFPYNTSGTPSTTVRIMAHDEITHALWPNEDSQWLLDNFPNPSSRDNYGMRQFVLAYRYRPLWG